MKDVQRYVFCSDTFPKGHTFYVPSDTDEFSIVFKNESIEVKVSSSGKIDLCDCNSNTVSSVQIPTLIYESIKHIPVNCSCDTHRITIKFPEYGIEDTYPNCDGEFDRWITTTTAYNYVHFDVSEGSASVVREEQDD